MTTMDLGSLGKLSASVLVITRFLSTSMKGKELGLEPVATMTCFAPMGDPFDRTDCDGVRVDKRPDTLGCTSMLFFFIRKLIPSVVWETTSPFLAIIWGKSMPNDPTSMPWVANCSLA